MGCIRDEVQSLAGAQVIREIILVSYAVIISTAILVWAYSRRPGSKLLRVDVLIDHVLHNRSSRLAMSVVWWWLGWHYLVAH